MKKRGDAKMKKMLWLGLFMFAVSFAQAAKNPENWESWESTEIANGANHAIFTSSSIFVDGVVICSSGTGNTSFAIFDSSVTNSGSGNFVAITTITLTGTNYHVGTYIPIKYQFSKRFADGAAQGFNLMFHIVGNVRWRVLYNWSKDPDMSLGN